MHLKYNAILSQYVCKCIAAGRDNENVYLDNRQIDYENFISDNRKSITGEKMITRLGDNR